MEKRNIRIGVPVTEKEHEKIIRLAEQRKLVPSEYMRELALGQMDMEDDTDYLEVLEDLVDDWDEQLIKFTIEMDKEGRVGIVIGGDEDDTEEESSDVDLSGRNLTNSGEKLCCENCPLFKERFGDAA